MRIVGIDTETFDPFLTTSAKYGKARGWSWLFDTGFVICTSLYYAKEDKKVCLKGDGGAVVKELLTNPEVMLIGANIQYDIGWLEYSLGIQGETKSQLIDVLLAESAINEWSKIDLDSLGKKYLKIGKTKSKVEEYCADKGWRGDFRKYLKDVPYDLVEEYALDDAMLPYLIWKKQLPILKRDKTLSSVKLDFDMILPTLNMTRRGVRIDDEKRKKNCAILTEARDGFKKEFTNKYGELNPNSSKQVAEFLDTQNIPYEMKITLKGYNVNGELIPFKNDKEMDEGMKEAKKFIREFGFVKKKPVAKISKKDSKRACKLLDDEGFYYICNPAIDKDYYKFMREEYPIVGVIADWKQADSIITKILGEGYERYIYKGRVHPVYNISKTTFGGTVTNRFSVNNPNIQQIPSKGELVYNGKTIKFAELCRGIFLPEEGMIWWSLDYSQVEYRLIVNFAVGDGAEAVRQQFIEHPETDYHQFVIDLTGLTRKYAKNMNFGVAFGMGKKTMAKKYGWSEEKVDYIWNTYHDAMPFLEPTMKALSEEAIKNGYIRTVQGRKARLKNKNLSYTMLNRLTQGSGADILKRAMRKAYQEGLYEKLNINITVHDEINGSMHLTKEGLKDLRRMYYIMMNETKLKVPLLSKPEIGEDWASIEELTFDEIEKKIA